MNRHINRRKFFQYSGFASASLLVPNFLKAFQNVGQTSQTNKVLVVVQLSGGNDGLNTVIPFRNDIYYRSRPTIAIEKDSVLKLTDELGLNPSMQKMSDLFHNGSMTILNNVGYPNPDRSHFRSMDIWQTASGSDRYLTSGWIGRFLDAQCPDCNNSYLAIEQDDTLSLAMKGNDKTGMAVSRPDMLYGATRNPLLQKLAGNEKNIQEDNLHYLYKTLVETTASAKYIYDHSTVTESKVEYPQSQFAMKLKRISELISSGIETNVYYVSHGSFDTHAKQSDTQNRLLQQLAEGLSAFVDDLKQNNRFNDVMIFTFSEFGRRVAQNNSDGTDHGTANNIFLLSGALKKPGIYNQTPNLEDLDTGDLKYQLDFRQLYATALNKWLNADDEKILGSKFELLDII